VSGQTPSPFVGREYERDALRAALDAAVAGSGGVVLLGGEPGIGKTRLATVLVDDAAGRGMPVWWGRGWEDATTPAYWPWNAALRGWVDHAGTAAVTRLAADLAPELTHVFPVLRERIAGLPAAPERDADQTRFRLFDAVSRFLATMAAEAGLVIVLDDVHWADGPSLKLLEFVAAELRHARLLIVATYRDTEVRRGHPFFGALGTLVREPATRRLTVPGLSVADCGRYLDLAAGDGAGETLGAELHRETNGNPFFLGEIVRLLSSEGRLDAAWDPRLVPPGVREVVARRIDRLGAESRAVLSVAALFGEAFERTQLERALEGTPGPAVADVLDVAVRDRILLDLERGRRYGFAHAVIRRVLIDEMEPSTRARWHGRIAETLESARETTADEIAVELARHFAAAGGPAGRSKAFEYARLGAERATRGLGWEEAARLYALALDLGGQAGALDDAQAIELQLALAHALRRAGDVAAARARCQDVAAVCRAANHPDLLARAALIHAGSVGDFYRLDVEGRALLEEATRTADAIDDGLRSRLYGRLAGDIIAANEIDQMARALDLSDEAAAAARRAGDAGSLAQALLAEFYVAALGTRRPGGTPADAVTVWQSLQDLLAQAEASGDFEFTAEIRHTRATALFALGEADGFRAEQAALATVAASVRVPEAGWLAEALASMRATVEGRFAEGRQLSEHALATGLRLQLANASGVHVGQEVMWHAVQGRLGEIVPFLEEFTGRHPGIVVWRSFLALARLARGDEVRARAEFHDLVALGFTPAKRGVHLRSYLAALAALCIGLREREHAQALYDLVARRPEPWVVDGCATLGPWAMALGSLARLCGRGTEALRHFEEAIRLGRRMRSRPVVAQAQSLLAGTLLSADLGGGARARAIEALTEAEQTARDLGLTDVLARVERLRAKHFPDGASARNTLRRDGDFWTVGYAGRSLQMKDGRGLHYLRTLLGTPGREFHVLQLSASMTPPGASASRPAELVVGAPGMVLDDGPDQRALRDYRARLDELRGELDQAEALGDLGRAQGLRNELETLMVGLSDQLGAPRQRGPSETARKAVTKALRTQIGKILEEHPALGRHLRDTVRLGTVCVYAPPVRVDWET
jgi:hypothetical protein